MKRLGLYLLLILTTFKLFAQQKESIKGSRNVGVLTKDLTSCKEIEIEDYFEVFLKKGDKPQLKIEADDNLLDIIKMDVVENLLTISITKEPVKYKKLSLFITYTNDFRLVKAKGNTVLNALEEVMLENLTVKSYDKAKIVVNAITNDFVLECNNDSSAEINIKSDNVKVVLSNNSLLNGAIKTKNLVFDLYQKSKATLEGNATEGLIRMDNNTNLQASKFLIKSLDLVTESFATCTVNTEESIQVTASGQTVINLLGEPSVSVKKFADQTQLIKKIK